MTHVVPAGFLRRFKAPFDIAALVRVFARPPQQSDLSRLSEHDLRDIGARDGRLAVGGDAREAAGLFDPVSAPMRFL